jgi:hypothetical protein
MIIYPCQFTESLNRLLSIKYFSVGQDVVEEAVMLLVCCRLFKIHGVYTFGVFLNTHKAPISNAAVTSLRFTALSAIVIVIEIFKEGNIKCLVNK